MAKKNSSVSESYDYLAQISLDIKEKDFKDNPALIKKFLTELKEVKAEKLALKDSLASTQNALEAQKEINHQLDKDNALLKAGAKTRIGLSIIQDVSAVGFGGGISALIASEYILGLSISVPTLMIYIACRIIGNLSNS